MRLRTISGATLTEAMAKVRDELGPEAVILHIEDAKSRKGVIIRAAADAPRDWNEAAASTIANERPEIEIRMEQELHGMLRMFQPRPRKFGKIDPEKVIAPACAYHRISKSLSQRLIELAEESGMADDGDALAHALERMMSFGPLPAVPARPIILLGAPGHGKSTVLARLGVRAVSAEKSLTIVTLDTGKAGAVSQIDTFANLLKARSEFAETPEALKEIVAAHAGTSIILIDTPGLNPWDPANLGEARQWIEASDAEPIWVTTPELDCEDIQEVAGIYARLGAKRCIVTKLDQVRRLGALVTLAHNGSIAMSHTVASPFLADGLQAASHLTIADALLRAYPSFQKQSTLSAEEARSA